MKENKMDLDWFPFKTSKWIQCGDVLQMEYDEKGIYLEMLIYQWHNDEIPADFKSFKKIFHVNKSQFKRFSDKVFIKFEQKTNEKGTFFVQESLRIIKEEQTEKHAKRVNAGRKGGKASSNATSKASSNAQASKNRIDKNRVEKNKDSDKRVGIVFDHYYEVFEKTASYQLTKPREAMITKALKTGYSQADLFKAIDNMKADDWVDRPQFSGLEYCLEITGKKDNVDKWLNTQPKQKKNNFSGEGEDFGRDTIPEGFR